MKFPMSSKSHLVVVKIDNDYEQKPQHVADGVNSNASPESPSCNICGDI